MLEVKGKYGDAKIVTDLVEETALKQVTELLNQEFTKDSKIRMMPDIHSGTGCVIGTTMTLIDRICPNLVGVDIGCGVYVALLNTYDIDFKKLDIFIREYIPSGFNIGSKIHPYINNTHLGELYCYNSVDINRAKLSLGTLGGGNHFIEIDRDDDGYFYLVIHSGSRHIGVEIAEYYQNWAYDSLKSNYNNTRKELITKLKDQGREQEISTELSKIKFDTPKDLCSLSGKLFDCYINDMSIAQEYAKWNRITIADEIIAAMGWNPIYDFETVHNYIDTKDMILRKGAVSAKKNEKLIIPINMRDGSLICGGKGNSDWNYSAPHGAGRLFSRKRAKEEFSLGQYKKSMDGIYTTSVNYDTLDECPMAYKPIDSIVNNIKDTVYIIKTIKPVYNFKAGN